MSGGTLLPVDLLQAKFSRAASGPIFFLKITHLHAASTAFPMLIPA